MGGGRDEVEARDVGAYELGRHPVARRGRRAGANDQGEIRGGLRRVNAGAGARRREQHVHGAVVFLARDRGGPKRHRETAEHERAHEAEHHRHHEPRGAGLAGDAQQVNKGIGHRREVGVRTLDPEYAHRPSHAVRNSASTATDTPRRRSRSDFRYTVRSIRRLNRLGRTRGRSRRDRRSRYSATAPRARSPP